MTGLRQNRNRVEITNLHTDAATNAFVDINRVRLPAFTADGFHWAVPRADHTARTSRRLNFKVDQIAADLRWAFLLVHMRLILMAEVFERTQYRVGSALPQTA